MIRSAEISDLSDLVRLSATLGYSISEAALLSNLTRLQKDDRHLLLVFDKEDKAIGFVEAERYEAVYHEGVMLNVLGLVVDEDQQDQGIGGQLMTALEAEARARGIFEIRLNSGEQRHLAHEFYEKQGYTSNHSQKRFMKSL